MAKKKKKKKRPSQGAGRRPQPSAPGGAVVGRATEGDREERRTAAKERRLAEQQRRRAMQRRKRMRNITIIVLIVAVLAGLIVWRYMANSSKSREASKLAAAAGCSSVKKFSHSGGESQHLAAGETATYDTTPPVGGRHAPNWLPAAVYTEPFGTDPAAQNSIFQAVHSLEHGAIIVWHNGLSEAELTTIDEEFGKERKVLVAPYPELKEGKVALTAWDRMQTCPKYDTEVVRAFIGQFREKTAPENNASV